MLAERTQRRSTLLLKKLKQKLHSKHLKLYLYINILNIYEKNFLIRNYRI